MIRYIKIPYVCESNARVCCPCRDRQSSSRGARGGGSASTTGGLACVMPAGSDRAREIPSGLGWTASAPACSLWGRSRPWMRACCADGSDTHDEWQRPAGVASFPPSALTRGRSRPRSLSASDWATLLMVLLSVVAGGGEDPRKRTLVKRQSVGTAAGLGTAAQQRATAGVVSRSSINVHAMAVAHGMETPRLWPVSLSALATQVGGEWPHEGGEGGAGLWGEGRWWG